MVSFTEQKIVLVDCAFTKAPVGEVRYPCDTPEYLYDSELCIKNEAVSALLCLTREPIFLKAIASVSESALVIKPYYFSSLFFQSGLPSSKDRLVSRCRIFSAFFCEDAFWMIHQSLGVCKDYYCMITSRKGKTPLLVQGIRNEA